MSVRKKYSPALWARKNSLSVKLEMAKHLTCSVCGQSLGQKGDYPAVKDGSTNPQQYRHTTCRGKGKQC